jgi:hypothetical protein
VSLQPSWSFMTNRVNCLLLQQIDDICIWFPHILCRCSVDQRISCKLRFSPHTSFVRFSRLHMYFDVFYIMRSQIRFDEYAYSSQTWTVISILYVSTRITHQGLSPSSRNLETFITVVQRVAHGVRAARMMPTVCHVFIICSVYWYTLPDCVLTVVPLSYLCTRQLFNTQ